MVNRNCEQNRMGVCGGVTKANVTELVVKKTKEEKEEKEKK
jgi:hypothetical protein